MLAVPEVPLEEVVVELELVAEFLAFAYSGLKMWAFYGNIGNYLKLGKRLGCCRIYSKHHSRVAVAT